MTETKTPLPSLDNYRNLMDYIVQVEAAQAQALGEILYAIYHPSSVIDWGCGPGIYLIPFKQWNCKVMGVDAEPAAGHALNGREFVHADLRIPHNYGKYSLALCIEVAEHLQPEFAETLVQTVTNSSDVVFWTAAIPGQGGEHHHNEQHAVYWDRLFILRHFLPDYETGSAIKKALISRIPPQHLQPWLLNFTVYLKRSPLPLP